MLGPRSGPGARPPLPDAPARGLVVYSLVRRLRPATWANTMPLTEQKYPGDLVRSEV